MSEDLKGLIQKIQAEGVAAGESRAREILEKARKESEMTMAHAREQGQKIIQDAEARARQIEESARASLKQAGRDMILSLRKEIQSTLERVVRHSVKESMSVEAMAAVLSELIKKSQKEETQDGIVVSLSAEQKEKLEKSFLFKLREETQRNIVLKPSDDIKAGFVISYDAGKSFFDFSDQALTEYIVRYLKPSLNGILEGGGDKD